LAVAIIAFTNKIVVLLVISALWQEYVKSQVVVLLVPITEIVLLVIANSASKACASLEDVERLACTTWTALVKVIAPRAQKQAEAREFVRPAVVQHAQVITSVLGGTPIVGSVQTDSVSQQHCVELVVWTIQGVPIVQLVGDVTRI